MSKRLNLLQQRINTQQKTGPQNRVTELLAESKIDSQQFRRLIFNEQYIQHMDKMYKLFEENKNLFIHPDIEQCTREQQRISATKQMMCLLKQMQIDLQKQHIPLMAKYYTLCSFNLGIGSKTFLHYSLYTSSLLLFSDQKQPVHQEFIQRAKQLKDLGCFGLTEFYHGSFTQGIVTDATYDHSSKQFILDSYGEKGMKFWIGASSQIANKAVLWANLKVNGNSYGPHPFVVPLRTHDTHDLLPGVRIGDCGPKNGLNMIDNGFIILEKFRIPRTHLLSKIGKIDQKGQYQSDMKSNGQRFGRHMSAISTGRAVLSQACLGGCTNALAIALRFVCQRRQFQAPDQTKETLLIDYPLSKYRIIPLIAQDIVYLCGGTELPLNFAKYREQLFNPKSRIANELHAIASACKSKATWFSIKAITECREMMGGHGYSAFSKLGYIYHCSDVETTWQGDNNMLLQQTAKYLLKAAVDGSGIIVNLSFVMNQDIQLPAQFDDHNICSIEMIQKLLKYRLKMLFEEAGMKMQLLKSQNLQNMDIWNRSQPHYCRQLALAFGDYYYFINTKRVMGNAKCSNNQKIFERIIMLWAFNLFDEQKFLTRDFRTLCRKHIANLCEQVYKQSLSILKVISLPESIVGSPFGKQEGGMKEYLNMLFSAKGTFERVDWFEKIIQLRSK